MTRPELHETLTALIEAMAPPAIDGAPRVTTAELDAPVELVMGHGPLGLVALAAPPASRFVTGFENPVHRLRITAIGQPKEGDAP